MRVTKVIVVPHVHWDREWYFTSEESQVLALQDFAEVLDYLEAHPECPSYVLDGQMAVVDEYLAARPGDGPRMERLVSEGRLQVGPWYTQTDEMIVGGESIVRNLLYGTSSARKLGNVMRIGYLPDSFGQSSQMPALLSGFGIDRAVFWRGQSQFSGTQANQFWWQSQDGSRVLTYQLPLGYATGKYLPCDPKAIHARLDRLFALMDEISPTPVAVLPNGHDQMPIQRDVEEVLKGLCQAYPDRQFVLGSYDDALDAIAKTFEGSSLPTVAGELLDGKRERVHRTIWSVRMDNKTANTRLENQLARHVEPLLVVAHELGIEVCPREVVRQAWRLLLENHAHDSMGGCCSDAVNAQIKGRFAEAAERVRLLSHYGERLITEAADVAGAPSGATPVTGASSVLEAMDHAAASELTCKLGLFNMNSIPDERLVTTEILTRRPCFELVDAAGAPVAYDVISVHEVDPGYVDRQIVAAGYYEPFHATTVQLRRSVPTVGYEVLGVREAEGQTPEVPEPRRGTDAQTSFETERYVVRANANGTVDLLDKESGRLFEGLFGLACEGNDGDEYDFSPVRYGREILSAEMVGCVPEITERRYSVVVRMAYELGLPATLAGWCKEAPCETRRLGVELELSFDRKAPEVGVQVRLDNEANDFRARIIVPTGISSQVSYADVQFNRIERPVVDPALAIWEEEGWAERPDAVFPFLSYVALSDDGRTVGVLTDGPREYEVVGEGHDTLAVTLLSCVGTLGKADMLRRPGRPSGISLPTPDAQCHGRLELDLAFVCVNEPIERARLASRAAQWLTPVEAYQQFIFAPIHLNAPTRSVPARFSLFSQSDGGVTLSCVKLAEERDAVVARFYNEEDMEAEPLVSGARLGRRLMLSEEPSEDNRGSAVGPHVSATFELTCQKGVL